MRVVPTQNECSANGKNIPLKANSYTEKGNEIELEFVFIYKTGQVSHKSRKENPQKLTQLSSRSHPRHLVGKRTAQKDTNIDITSDSQVNSNFPYRWSPASLTFNKLGRVAQSVGHLTRKSGVLGSIPGLAT